MSKLATQLNPRGLHNNWDLLKRFGKTGDVAIEYHRPAPGRLGIAETTHTRVWSYWKTPHLERPTNGASGVERRFPGKKSHSFPLALKWAMDTFKHTYVPSPFGGWIPRHVLGRAKLWAQEGGEKQNG